MNEYNDQNDPEEEITDEAISSDNNVDILPRFDITAYGADYPVDALVQRFRSGDIEVPQWQRGWVWKPKDAARFIESLLLGLPVPSIFLYEEPGSKKLIVIDGQQRLRSLVAFYDNQLNGYPFKLPEYEESRYQSIHPDFAGKSYVDLLPSDRRGLDNQIIHATIVKQNSPDGDLSIYHLFERINSTGARLTSQEIRAAIYRGEMDTLLQKLNDTAAWRAIYGKRSVRLKDQELILRFLALRDRVDNYERPMTDFLNEYMRDGRSLDPETVDALEITFAETIKKLYGALGEDAFRPARAINAAVFDGVMVGLSRRLELDPTPSDEAVAAAYHVLLADEDFQAVYLRATSDTESVKERIRIATEKFAAV